MANDCWYSMVAVAPKKETLERFIKIMNYEDEEYFIYRCRSSSPNEIVFDEKSNLYYVGIQGDVAWSCERWFETVENKNELIANGTAHYITLDLLCQKLNFGLEVFAEESGCCFQEHHTVYHSGEHYGESEEWHEEWCDEDGNELDEPISVGGFDYYLQFNNYEEIYGE
jgi:hypothetical protein